MTRLVLVTGHQFGVRAFEGIFSSAAYLAGRVTVPLIIGLADPLRDAPAGFQSAIPLALEHHTGWAAASDGRLAGEAARIRAAEPDYLLVVGWSRLIGEDILAIPARGAIGMHPSPLPVGRGRAPIPWTIIKGLRETALSVFFLDGGADTGPLIAQYPLAVRARETSASLFARMAVQHQRAGTMLARYLARPGRVASRPQAGRVEVWPKRTPADGEITAEMTCGEVDALVRAQLGPYPRAFAAVGNGGPVPVRAVAREQAAGAFPFRCADGTVWLTREAAA